jgi:hypothetical protein
VASADATRHSPNRGVAAATASADPRSPGQSTIPLALAEGAKIHTSELEQPTQKMVAGQREELQDRKTLQASHE